MSEFYIQVIHKPTRTILAKWAPGLAAEKDFEQELLDRVKAKGVGFLRTEAQVIEAVRSSLKALLYDLKSKV